MHTSCCFPGLPLFFLPLISGSSISLMLILKLTASVAPDSLDESLKNKGQENLCFGACTHFKHSGNANLNNHCTIPRRIKFVNAVCMTYWRTGSSEVIILLCCDGLLMSNSALCVNCFLGPKNGRAAAFMNENIARGQKRVQDCTQLSGTQCSLAPETSNNES